MLAADTILFRSEHLRSKESEVSKSAANNESLATGQAETDHREKEEEVEEEEEEEEMRRSVNLPLDLWLLGASRSIFFDDSAFETDEPESCSR